MLYYNIIYNNKLNILNYKLTLLITMSSFPNIIPITVLTGFLGSGKTTLLSELVKKEKVNDIAFIINEFGEVGLDHSLIESTDENIVELQNGCICCTIQEDLKSTLLNLLSKMEKGLINKFNRVIIETTGLADPVPIIHTLMTSIDLIRVYIIDGVITIVDAVNGNKTFDNHLESIKQTSFANKIILSKVDLGNDEKIKQLIERINKINPKAPVVESKKDKLQIKEFFELNDYQPLNKSWNVRKWLAEERKKNKYSHNHEHHHDLNRHNDNIRSFSLVSNKPVSITTLNFFLELVSAQMGENMLRIKGIINVKGEDRPAIIHGVQHIFHPLEWLDKWPDNDFSTRLVFITSKIEKSVIEQFFQILK